MPRSDPLANFKRQASRLRTLFQDKSLEWFDSALSGKHEGSGEPFTPEALYELLCYFSLVRVLRPKVSGLRLIRAPESAGYRFPYAPGDKDRFAFFRFEYQSRTFDLCLGTSLPDPHDGGQPDETPDISLQAMPGSVNDADARVGEPLRIWDAKYHAKERFAKHDYQQIATWCDILDLPVAATKDVIISGLLSASFELSAVLTNAQPSPFNARIARAKKFRVVFNFNGNLARALVRP